MRWLRKHMFYYRLGRTIDYVDTEKGLRWDGQKILNVSWRIAHRKVYG